MYLGELNKPLSSTLQAIPDGKAGTVATLKIMRDAVRAGKQNLDVRTKAVELVNGYRQKDWIAELKSLHAFVRDKIRYTKDITDVETIQTPDVTLRVKAGDCDDKVVLLCSLLESIGHPTRMVAIGFRPDEFVHVYLESRVGSTWIPAETTEPVEIGWAPKNVVSRLTIYN
jgi:transglutaminase-like putative cysteine protease